MHVARERRGAVEAQRVFRVGDLDLEGGAFVLLDPDPAQAAQRGANPPAPEEATGRDIELPAHRSEGVGGGGGGRHLFAVGVEKLNLERGVRHRPVLDLLAAATIGDGLPVELLPWAVDRTVGVDQGRAVDHASAIALLVEPGGVEGEILVVTPDEKVLVVLPVEQFETHPAVVAGPQPLDLAVATPIVVTVERNRHTLERVAARPRARGHLVATLEPAGHQHQVREDEALGDQEVVALREIGPHGGHDQVGAGH